MAKVLCLSLLTAGVSGLLSGCGNKGELFLVPDEMTEEELQRLEQSLGRSTASDIEPAIDVDDVPDTGDDIEGSKKAPKKNDTTNN